ncbi:hypothetical protein [Geomobilimonas luticola]|uniref:Uncharacterized protein n=1 Tax=Geomobilimonas luticola TaxID=1114878 RepID=A0ABS5SAS6_9BACT|nr:hypothetical protein [Geomobilimonas luticola]MBT0652461.1 hypothetical protein [Geomobilimonas luticola]
MTIRNVAILMLVIILMMPAAVHAHALEMRGAETSPAAAGGCHDADHDADQDSTGNHQFDVRCCELDTPYALPSPQSLVKPAVTGILACTLNGRQLDGYSRRIYKPPR